MEAFNQPADNFSQQATQQAVDIARLQVQVEHLTDEMQRLREVNRQQSVKLDMVLDKLAEAKGGWQAMMFFGGAAASAGGAIAWVVDFFIKR